MEQVLNIGDVIGQYSWMIASFILFGLSLWMAKGTGKRYHYIFCGVWVFTTIWSVTVMGSEIPAIHFINGCISPLGAAICGLVSVFMRVSEIEREKIKIPR